MNSSAYLAGYLRKQALADQTPIQAIIQPAYRSRRQKPELDASTSLYDQPLKTGRGKIRKRERIPAQLPEKQDSLNVSAQGSHNQSFNEAQR